MNKLFLLLPLVLAGCYEEERERPAQAMEPLPNGQLRDIHIRIGQLVVGPSGMKIILPPGTTLYNLDYALSEKITVWTSSNSDVYQWTASTEAKMSGGLRLYNFHLEYPTR